MVLRSERPASASGLTVVQGTVAVKVVLMGELRQLAGRRDWHLEFPQGSTVRTLLKELSSRCGTAFAQHALTREGDPHPHVAVFVNGEDIRQLQGTRTVLTGGQVELFMVPINEGGN
ncbi:MAG: MoaD/ThiS family protein [Chloroflexi bacterium]|nr:MoaD/ThiS family protein [Chloroflexota bacterium]